MIKRSVRHVGAKIAIDLFVLFIAFQQAFQIRFDRMVPGIYRPYLGGTILAAVLIHFVGLALTHRYQCRWRYTSVYDASLVALATALSIPILGLVLPYILHAPVPRGVLIIDALLNFLLLVCVRFLVRVYVSKYHLWKRLRGLEHRVASRRVLIVGAGPAGEQVARSLQHVDESLQQPYEWKVIGFVDDDPDRQRTRIHGVPVLGPIHYLPILLETRDINEVLVAMPRIAKKRLSEIIQLCERSSARLSIIPDIDQLMENGDSLRRVRDIKVEDLLARDPIQLDTEQVRSFLADERVLVTGAGGSIGSEICRQVAGMKPEQLIMLGRGENSIFEALNEMKALDPSITPVPVIASVQDKDRMRTVFETYRPTVVFHAAAHKHVPLMEAHPTEAIMNNVFGTRNIVNLSDQYGVKKFVLISTDKAVNPTSVMGASKRLAEMVLQAKALVSQTEFVAVRFGNVLGSRGSVVPTMQRQIERGGPVMVTHEEMTRYFMTIPEAVGLVLQAGAMGKSGEVFVLDMGSPVKIIDLARNLIRLSGKVPDRDIAIKITGPRPGEKLYEELMTAEEGTLVTRNHRIFVTRGHVGRLSRAELAQTLKEFELAIADGGDERIFQLLRRAVPTYQSPEYHSSLEDVEQVALSRNGSTSGGAPELSPNGTARSALQPAENLPDPA